MKGGKTKSLKLNKIPKVEGFLFFVALLKNRERKNPPFWGFSRVSCMWIHFEDISITLKQAKMSGQIKDKPKDQSYNDQNN